MSLESAKAFLERIKTDEAFAKKVSAAKDPAARKTLVKAEGFDFDKKEIKEVVAELTPEEMSKVAGGGSSCDTDSPAIRCRVTDPSDPSDQSNIDIFW